MSAPVHIAGLFALALVVVPGTAWAGAGDLAAARSLYASALYEEALAELAAIDGVEDTELVDQYRALCLLALGRTGEAERSLEHIIIRKPLYMIAETDVSPRLVVMFHDVRKRTLPVAARELYAKAKANFDTKAFVAAAEQFQQLLAIVNDPDASDHATALAEFRQLGEGFLTLTKAELAAAATLPPPAVYTSGDKGITPPVELEKSLPRWRPSPGAFSRNTLQGLLEIVVDERGTVELATVTKSISPVYDDDLVSAAIRWRFRPATRDGKPVKYRKLVEIVLSPSGRD
jgi:tetratricopeptide (TPR) repeat protein